MVRGDGVKILLLGLKEAIFADGTWPSLLVSLGLFSFFFFSV